MIHTNRILLSLLLFVAVALISACGGSADGTTLADVVEQVAGSSAESAGSSEGAAGAPGSTIGDAQATVSARSLRVRAEPSPTAEVVGGIKEGEVYAVIGLSSDGEWIQLAVPAIPGGEGWVSANFVSVQGAITGATITEAAPASAPAAADSSGGLPTATPRVAPQIPAVPGTATIATDGLRLRVRAQPSADAEIVGYVYEGEVYEVASTSGDGLWTELRGRTGTDNVNGGWVATEFLVIN
jgi:N-acetylmuramoyl-L-alanine amidase